jgi:hypothetical protein
MALGTSICPQGMSRREAQACRLERRLITVKGSGPTRVARR